ncbi:hypothetical protein DM860_003009 [Cuscuta australis]|uniref:CRIB domain-containing protein n=1 Tax=Cuscuta australis TaxID=267555 RepID=A0A328D1V7_9ASTE|nr:hypothetical protein DM860_003009 [Cuscuta australis]
MMGTFKAGFKYICSTIFVVEEPEIEIGYPTNVKHVAHIGWDGHQSGASPTWMKEFMTGPDFAVTSIGKSELHKSATRQSGVELASENPVKAMNHPKKQKRKKGKSKCQSTSSSSCSPGSSLDAKSKSKFIQDEI